MNLNLKLSLVEALYLKSLLEIQKEEYLEQNDEIDQDKEDIEMFDALIGRLTEMTT